MSLDSSLAPLISVRLSDVENGAALTFGSATLHLTRPETIWFIDELGRTLFGKPLPAIPFDAQESHRSGRIRPQKRAHWRTEVNPTGFV